MRHRKCSNYDGEMIGYRNSATARLSAVPAQRKLYNGIHIGKSDIGWIHPHTAGHSPKGNGLVGKAALCDRDSAYGIWIPRGNMR